MARLKAPEGHRKTPIAQILFDKFEAAQEDKQEVALALGYRPATFNARLNGQTYLHQSRKKDVDFILQVCQFMKWDADELMAEASRMGQEQPTPDLTILSIFLDTIEDPNRSSDQKEAARSEVLRMFLEK